MRVPCFTIALLLLLSGAAAAADPVVVRVKSAQSDTLVLVAGGDINLAEDAEPTLLDHGGAYAFEHLRPLLRGDALLGNLETVVSDREPLPRTKKSKIRHLMQPSLIGALADEGFTALAVANNHGMDYGLDGLQDTRRYVEAAGMVLFGGGQDREEATRGVVLDNGAVRVGLLSLSQVWRGLDRLKGGWYARDDAGGVAPLQPDRVAADISELAAHCDYVVVTVHWGANYRGTDSGQRRLAKALVSAGADAVLGTGAHMAQSTELVDGVPVVYSLGNLTFGSWGGYGRSKPRRHLSSLARLRFTRAGLTRLELAPIHTDNKKVKFQPRPTSKRHAQREFEPSLARVRWERRPSGWYLIDLSGPREPDPTPGPKPEPRAQPKPPGGPPPSGDLDVLGPARPVLKTWRRELKGTAPRRARRAVGGAVALLLLALLLRGRGARLRRWLPIVGAAAGGGWALLRALDHPSLFDDAYISLRYARNLAEGQGLVFNVGERVEGYTNFLWTLLIGLLHAVSPWEAPEIALVLSLLALVATLALVAWVGGHLARGGLDVGAPVLLLAALPLFTDYGTTGMETGACALGVTAVAAALLRSSSPRAALAAGAAGILLTLTRPDHALFYAAGAAAVALEQARVAWAGRAGGLRWREVLAPAAAYALPFTLYLAYLAWKIAYYGDYLPNTYYAKSGGEAWYTQGGKYAASFYLGTGAWVLLVAALAWLLAPARDAGERRLRTYAVVGLGLYNLYVVRVGGDFMFGRFYVSTLPLLALLSTAWLPRLVTARQRLPGVAVAALLAGLLAGATVKVPLLSKGRPTWGIADEARTWRLRSVFPAQGRHDSYGVGKAFGQLADAGIPAILGSGGIGNLGYYSRLELVDLRGLTDSYVAHRPLKRRGRPGHEKAPPRAYIAERGIHFLRANAGWSRYHPERFRDVTAVRLSWHGRKLRQAWQLARWDGDLMDRVANEVEGIDFVWFPHWLDRYLLDLDDKRPADVRRDLKWLRSYYFDYTDDPERLHAIQRWLARHP